MKIALGFVCGEEVLKRGLCLIINAVWYVFCVRYRASEEIFRCRTPTVPWPNVTQICVNAGYTLWGTRVPNPPFVDHARVNTRIHPERMPYTKHALEMLVRATFSRQHLCAGLVNVGATVR